MTAMKRLAPVLFLLALAAIGCTRKKPPAPVALPEETIETGLVVPATPPSATSSAPRIGGSDPLSGSLEEVNAYLREKGLIGDVYFDFDSPSIRAEDVPRLRQNAEFMRQHPEFVFTIEGHCDERDTIEYNLALGQRRAKATQIYLADLEVSRDRLQTISYGKERPFCDSSNEECWSQNRRAHFVVAERR
jgi:peptidoglycan-associated lipoprotein